MGSSCVIFTVVLKHTVPSAVKEKGSVMKKRSKAPGWVGFDHSQMFNLVIMQEDVCQRLLERILGIQIERLEFENVEHAIDPSIEGRGVRLDASTSKCKRRLNTTLDADSAITNR